MKRRVFIVCALLIDILAFILHLDPYQYSSSRIRKLTSYLKKSNTAGDNEVVLLCITLVLKGLLN